MDATPRPGLLATTRNLMRARRMSLRTEGAYLHWIRRLVEFHGRRPPQELGAVHVEAFLTDLATRQHVAASTQNQALCAILFLYKQVLGAGFPWLVANLLYGGGLRLDECLSVRAKSIDYERRELVVRDGTGRIKRTTLPESLREPIAGHMARLL